MHAHSEKVNRGYVKLMYLSLWPGLAHCVGTGSSHVLSLGANMVEVYYGTKKTNPKDGNRTISNVDYAYSFLIELFRHNIILANIFMFIFP